MPVGRAGVGGAGSRGEQGRRQLATALQRRLAPTHPPTHPPFTASASTGPPGVAARVRSSSSYSPRDSSSSSAGMKEGRGVQGSVRRAAGRGRGWRSGGLPRQVLGRTKAGGGGGGAAAGRLGAAAGRLRGWAAGASSSSGWGRASSRGGGWALVLAAAQVYDLRGRLHPRPLAVGLPHGGKDREKVGEQGGARSADEG